MSFDINSNRAALGLFAGLLFAITPTEEVGAACPADKEEITVVNKAGKVMTLCVSASAIPNLGGGGEVVIAGSCPCFSQENVESAIAVDPTITCSILTGIEKSGEFCQRAQCSSTSFYFGAEEETAGDECLYDVPVDSDRAVDSWCDGGNGEVPISEVDATACVEIIKTFVP